MANVFLNATVYANTMLLLLKNQLVWGRLVDGQFKDQVTDENGLIVNAKRPPRFIAKSGASIQAQDIIVGSTSVAVDQYTNVHLSVGDLEYVQSFNALVRNESMKSAASTLAHKVDNFIASKSLLFPSWIAGTAPGTVSGNASDPTKMIATPAQAMAAGTRLMAQGCPDTDLSAVVSFDDGQSIRGSLLTAFLPDNKTALERSRIPMVSNIDWYQTQQLPSLTTGTRTQGDGSSTGAQVDGGAQNVNYRSVKTTMIQNFLYKSLTTTMTIKAGEVFTIQNVYAWDWRNQVRLPYLQQFTVLGDVTSSSGAGTLSISPPIIVPATNDGTSTDANTAFATVDSIPADNAYVKFAGALSTVLQVRSAFQKRAISLVSARLQMPFTGVASQAVDPETGIAIRYWRGSDIATGAHIHRWDMIYGGTVMDPFLGTRICGT